MIAVFAPWILLSLLVGFFGRNRRGGFWGLLFFSLLFTPIAGGLAVMLAGPGKETQQAHARQLAAVQRSASGLSSPRRPAGIGAAVSSLIVWWGVLLLIFTAGFVVTEGSGSGGFADGFKAALEISIDAGTFRITGTDVGNGSPSTRALIGLEGFLVLVLLVLKAARFATSGHDRVMHQLHSDAIVHVERLEELQSTLRAQQMAVDQLRATTEAKQVPVIIEHQG
jgi:hypothetical protein